MKSSIMRLFRRRGDTLAYQPKVSVIIPNYNHARFLDQRIRSVLEQTYRNFDLLILDDASTDESRSVIERHVAANPDRIRFLPNDTNSGRVFSQWEKGIAATDGELIWICESDDFCERDFLERIVPAFRDRSVNLAFGRIQFAHPDGTFREGLDAYREGAEPGIWDKTSVRPARQWFHGGFGVNNVIANVGGSVWRRKALPASVWQTAKTYSVLGDWYLYSIVAAGGQIAYEPSAVTYFRIHDNSTSFKAYTTPAFYEEHDRFMKHIAHLWGLEEPNLDLFLERLSSHYVMFKGPEILGDLRQFIRKEDLMAVERSEAHLLIVFLGFVVGGGEVFPIHLANELFRRGIMVSMLALQDSVHPLMSDMLDPGIPVYSRRHVDAVGVRNFVCGAGITLIHSHVLYAELFLFDAAQSPPQVPYVVSLHGSYEAIGIEDATMMRMLRGISVFVYTAQKNLDPWCGFPVRPDIFVKMGNGMPFDPRPFPRTRADMGIAPDAVVFTLVARGVVGKGWEESVRAFAKLREDVADGAVHLLLCGEGEEADRVRRLLPDVPHVTYLGFQSCITGLYALSDCALLPSTYSGESFPLCVIQALQAKRPIIATKIGEVEAMLTTSEGVAGLLMPMDGTLEERVANLAAAMRAMLDAARRARLSELAVVASRRFAMDKVADQYLDIYDRATAEFIRRREAKDVLC